MTFITLEERFNSVSTQIYNRFTTSTGQYVAVKPNTAASNTAIRSDTRALPRISVQRDVERIAKFWGSSRGTLFISKQLLLQTENTFAETRLYNPLSPRLNVPPFLHFVRHFGRPISNLRTPTRDLRGALQQDSVDKFTTEKQGFLTQLKNTVTSPFKAYKYKPQFTKYFGEESADEYYVRPEDNIFYRYKEGKDYKNIVLDIKWEPNPNGGGWDILRKDKRQLEFGPRLFPRQLLSERGTPKIFSNPSVGSRAQDRQGSFMGATTRAPAFITYFLRYGTQKPDKSTDSKTKTFKNLENTQNTNGYFRGLKLDVQNLSSAENNTDKLKLEGGITPTVNDPLNLYPLDTFKKLKTESPEIYENFPIIYQNIVGEPFDRITDHNTEMGDRSDIIPFVFQSAERNAPKIHFRAFISSLKENVKPEYNEQRYLGRTERYVNYAGSKRSVSLQFNIAAFSQLELNRMWSRINYLTGLAFPKGASDSGFMIPPLFKITIGDIYNEQPCYLESLDHEFLDDSITFDIDDEVSQVINVNMSIVLIETGPADLESSFYGITTETA